MTAVLERPVALDRRAPARGERQPFTMLQLLVRDLAGEVVDPPVVDGVRAASPWCGDRGERWPGDRGPACTRRTDHGGRHHAADGTWVYAVWGVRA